MNEQQRKMKRMWMAILLGAVWGATVAIWVYNIGHRDGAQSVREQRKRVDESLEWGTEAALDMFDWSSPEERERTKQQWIKQQGR